MQVQPITNKHSLVPKADGLGRLVVTARLGNDAVEGRAVSLHYALNNSLGGLVWETSNTFPTGFPFELFGVTLSAGETGDVVPVAIFGQVNGVTLPAAVTGNAGLLRGGTRNTATAGLSAGALTSDRAVAEITDAKTGSQNQRDLFLFGKQLILETLFRSTGRVKDNTGPLSQSMLMDGDGNGYLMVDATDGLTEGRLTLLRRGRTTSWKATYKTGAPNLGDAVSDSVLVYGVPVVDVAAASGATGRVQVLGKVDDCDLGARVATQTALSVSFGDNRVSPSTNTTHGRIYALTPDGSALSPGRMREIHLLGRIFSL